MGLLTRRYKLAPMGVPLPGLEHVALPDLELMRKNSDRIQMTNDVALGEAQSRDVKDFSQQLGLGLYTAFADKIHDMNTPQDDEDRLMGAIGMSVCLGMGYSAVDDKLGVPKQLTERCTYTALNMGVTMLDAFPPAWQQPVMFSMQAGHYMGRMGRSTIPLLLQQAEQ